MQIIVNGIVSGLAIAMLALAFQAVYLPTRVFFIGMAGVYAISPFIALSVLDAGGSLWAAGLTSVIVAVFICLACEYLIHAPLERRRAGGGAHLIASLGYSIIIVQIISIIWGNNKQVLRTGTSSISQFGGVTISGEQWIIFGVTSTAITAFLLVLMRANLGLRLRALADNPTQFALFGYNVNYHRLLSFGLAGLLTSAASLVTAYDVGFDVNSGLRGVLLAIVAVVIGGQSSFAGPVLSGLLLGVIRSQVVWYWEARWEEPITFLLLALVLLLLPQGLLGRMTRLENNP
jgi:branched-subunit amino acid ABC-type transport system permease component